MKSRRAGWIVCLGTGLMAVAGVAFGASASDTEALAAAERFGIKMADNVPMISVDRAYTSPIWYTP